MKGEFVDVLSLLPMTKEFILQPDKKGEDRLEEDRCRPIPHSFNWLQAFCLFAGVLVEKHPSLSGGLF